MQQKNFTPAQIEIIKTYIKTAKNLNKHPSRKHLKNEGISKDKVEYHFGNLFSLKQAAKDYDSKAFNNLIDDEVFNAKNLAKVIDAVGKYNKFVITSAVTGCKVHEGFYKSLKNYCKVNNACLLVLPVSDPANTRDKNKWALDQTLLDNEYIVFSDIKINSNLFVSAIHLTAKQIDPITGLSRLGERTSSVILASPKQRLKMIPTSNNSHPQAIMTTGVITKPDYTTEYYMSERTAYLAEGDHIIGSIVVEVQDDKIFHFRQIQSDKSGGFVDLGNYYKEDKIIKCNPKAFVIGDLHSGEEDESVVKAWIDVIKELKPEIIVLHDVFNGTSISHWLKGKSTLKAIRAKENKLNLEEELKLVARNINMFSALCSQVVIVKSNHDQHLDRYIDENRYIDDPQNHLISLKLAIKLIEKEDPLKYGVEINGLKNHEKVKWLTRDESFKVNKIELGVHGDRGINGSRGNLKSTEASYGYVVSAHLHSSEILRQAYQVGTSTKLKLDYNIGTPSSWSHTSCLVYDNSSRQLINVIEGNWKL